jgi:predicted Fe-Mo cluster-binding NifX family protein
MHRSALFLGDALPFIFVDTDTMAFEAVPNPALNARAAQGTQAAPAVIQHGAQAILSNPLGPNALRVVQAAGIPIYEVMGATVRQAVAAFIAGQATPATTPTTTRAETIPQGVKPIRVSVQHLSNAVFCKP